MGWLNVQCTTIQLMLNSTEFANTLLEKMERVYRFVSKHLKLSSQIKRNYDRRATPHFGFWPGDIAWLYNPQR